MTLLQCIYKKKALKNKTTMSVHCPMYKGLQVKHRKAFSHALYGKIHRCGYGRVKKHTCCCCSKRSNKTISSISKMAWHLEFE